MVCRPRGALLDVFINSIEDTIFEWLPTLTEIQDLGTTPSYSKMQDVEDSPHCVEFIGRWENFKNDVRSGSLGKTAKFWIAYCNRVWILMRFQKAIKENNLPQ